MTEAARGGGECREALTGKMPDDASRKLGARASRTVSSELMADRQVSFDNGAI